jgi:hypothetical protein
LYLFYIRKVFFEGTSKSSMAFFTVYGVKGREEPGVRRLLWCEVQWEARGMENQLVWRAERSPGYGGSSGVRGREEPGELRIHWCEGQWGARSIEDPLVKRAGRSPGYEGSSGEKGREQPGAQRIHWCAGQGGARGMEAPLIWRSPGYGGSSRVKGREEPQKYPDVARLHQLEIQSPTPPLPLWFQPYCVYIAPLRHVVIVTCFLLFINEHWITVNIFVPF